MKVGRFAALHTRFIRPDSLSPPYDRPGSAVGTARKLLPVQQGRVAPRPAWRPEALRSSGRAVPTVRTAGISRTVFTAVLIGTGVTVGAAGAHAQPAADPHQFSDHTAEFVPLGAPNALAARDTGKQLVLSPHGTRRSIVCRGDGITVPRYDCSQEDGLGWAPLHRTDTPVGEVWIYFP